MTRLEQLQQQRTKEWLPLGTWGPVCAGCGGDEYRIDGFCSIECRDYHCDEDVRDLLAVAVAAQKVVDDPEGGWMSPLRAVLAPLLEDSRA